MSELTFPDGFLWGAGTAAHQIEGGNTNSSTWEVEWKEHTIFSEPSGDACDSYHRYTEDIALLAESGLNTYRFSVEWARIEPEEGFFSRAALDHYRRMVETCHAHGVVPMITLQHFTLPAWFARRGGWTSESAADLFGRYCERVVEHLGDLVEWWCTINEANVVSVLQSAGMLPAGSGAAGASDDPAQAILAQALYCGFPFPDVTVMSAMHARAVDAVRAGSASAKVGWTLALVDYQAEPGGEEHLERVRAVTQLAWLDAAKSDDFIGVQTYTRGRFGPEGRIPPGEDVPTSQVGWEIYPPALEHTVRLAALTTGLPVFVTENGLATADDSQRIAYTQDALRGLHRAVSDGVEVLGYLHWTLLDNFEWMSGYGPHFGLVEVDRDTFARTPKPSLEWLGGRARAGAISG